MGLRVSGICPDIFIAVFYTGLGAALLTAGLLFLRNYVKHRRCDAIPGISGKKPFAEENAGDMQE